MTALRPSTSAPTLASTPGVGRGNTDNRPLSADRVTAAAVTGALTITSHGSVTASTLTRTLAGPVVEFGKYGRTSAGRLKVAPGALRLPEDHTRVKLTKEHDRGASRGYLADWAVSASGIRAALRVSDGPEGDAALREAADHTRDGFSFDVIDATIEGDTITDALVIAIGQVGIPAYDDMRIDTIAASQTHHNTTNAGGSMTQEQRDRLAALRAQETLTQAEAAELATLAALESSEGEGDGAEGEQQPPAEGEQQPPAESGGGVSASVPSVPGGVPATRRAPARTRAAAPGGALRAFVQTIVAAYGPGGGGGAAISAALNDVTNTANPAISAPAWSAELWSGLAYEPEFTPLLNSGDLTSWEGNGWRWVTKPVMGDYAGDKAAIPSGILSTESSAYTAARMAVGHDIDRKFYDFPDAGFIASYLEACRESWAMKLDGKVEAFLTTEAVPVQEAGVDATRPTLLKAAARAIRALKRAKVGRATFVVVNDDDLEALMDVSENALPAFLDLFNVDPANFTSSDQVAAGKVIAGVRQAATVRTLPGSPIRVSAQNLANGGVDEAFFGYWAVEQHHESGIVSVKIG